MVTTEHITTAQQLLETPGLGRCELVRGDLIITNPAGFEHGRIVSRINARLENFVERGRLGVVTGAETEFFIGRNPDTVRAPDVGFVRTDRVPAAPTPGFFEGPPDLAVEVLSPTDSASEVLAKVQDWLASGCRAVWVVDSVKQTVSVYRSQNQTVVWTASDALTDEQGLPGFELHVAEIFAT